MSYPMDRIVIFGAGEEANRILSFVNYLGLLDSISGFL